MPTLDDIRKLFPETQGMSDKQLLDQTAKLTGLPVDQVAKDFEFGTKKGGLMGTLADVEAGAVKSLAGMAKSGLDWASPGNRVSKYIGDKFIPGIERGETEQTQLAGLRFDERVAKGTGAGDEVSAALQYVREAPASTVGQVGGMYGGIKGIITGAQVGAKALGLGAKGVSRTGLGAAAATGGVMGGGDAAGSAYDLVEQIPIEKLRAHPMAKGMEALSDEELKHTLATKAARDAQVIPTVIGAASGLVGVDRLFAGGKGFAGNAVSRGLKTGLVEGGSEFGEEFATNYEGRRGAQQFDPSIDPLKGSFAAGTMGAVQGGGMGVVAGALTPGRSASILPDANPDRANDSQGKQLGLGYQPVLGTFIGFPDGSTAHTEELADYIRNIPEEDRVTAMGVMLNKLQYTPEPDVSREIEQVVFGERDALVDFINKIAGVTRPALPNDQASMQAALDEATALYGQDADGLERQITLGDLVAAGIEPQEMMVAIRSGNPESVQALIDRITGVTREGVPNNVQSMQTAYNEPTAMYGQDANGLERNIPVGDMIAAGLDPAALATAQAQEQAPSKGKEKGKKEEATPEQVEELYATFGQPQENFVDTTDGRKVRSGLKFDGQVFASMELLKKHLNKLAKANAQKTNARKASEFTFAKAVEPVLGRTPTSKEIDKAMNDMGVDETTDPLEVVARIDIKLDKLEGKKSNDAVAAIEQLTAWRSALDPDGKIVRKAATPAAATPAAATATENAPATTTQTVTVKQGRGEVTVDKVGMARMLAERSPEDKFLMNALMGLDEQGNSIGQPMTLTQVADAHAKKFKRAKPMTAEGIRQRLMKYGIDSEVVTRMAAISQDTAKIEELLPEGTEEGQNTGLRVVNNPNNINLVEPKLTGQAAVAEKAANKLLKADKKANKGQEPAQEVVTAEKEQSEREIAERKVREAQENVMRLLAKAARSQYAQEAIKAFDARMAKANKPFTFASMVQKDQASWIDAYEAVKFEKDDDKLASAENDLEGLYKDVLNDLEVIQNAETNRQLDGRADGDNGAATGATPTSGPGDNAAGETGGTDTVVGDYRNAKTEVKVRKKRQIVKPEQSRSWLDRMLGKEETVPEGRSDAKALEVELRDFLRVGALGRNIVIVQSLRDPRVAAYQSMGVDGKTQAFVDHGENKVFLIADNIREGRGRAVFMHEVGGHFGLQRLLPRGEFERLADLIEQWAEQNNDSQESELAIAATNRVMRAGVDVNSEKGRNELVAYFIEEAVNDGVDPTANQMNSPLARWFRSLWAAFKSAMRRFNVNPDALTAQDIVDMAYGAARLETKGGFHGTATKFRKFNHRFMGSGEGAQVYGWGSYFAERFGIAETYRKEDVKRKTNPRNSYRDPKVVLADGTPLTNTQQFRLRDWELVDDKGALVPDWEQKFDALVVKTKAIMEPVLAWDAKLAQAEKEWAEAKQIREEKRSASVRDYKDIAAKADADAAYEDAMAAGERLRQLRVDPARVSKGYAFFRADNVMNELQIIMDAGGLKPYQKQTPKTDGVTYRVDFNIADDEWLMWDEDFIDQSDTVREALLNKLPEGAWQFVTDMWGDPEPDGEAIYRGLTKFMRSDKAASELLDSIGIKGLKFRDAQSRGRNPDRTHNSVVFNDKNIQRVSTLKGGSREKGIEFSVADKLPSNLQEPSNMVKDFITGHAKKGMYVAAFTNDLIDMVKDAIPTAVKYRDMMTEKAATRFKYEAAVETIIQDAMALPEDVRNRINDFVYKSTSSQKWGFDPKIAGKTVVEDAALKAEFNRLPPKAQDVVRAIFKHGEDSYKLKQDLLNKEINNEYNQLLEQASTPAEKARVEAERQQALKRHALPKMDGPYAPLKRFGNWVVTARSKEYLDAVDRDDKKWLKENQDNEKHNMVQFAESEVEARAMARKLAGGYHQTDAFQKELYRDQIYSGVADFEAFRKMKEELARTLKGGVESAGYQRMQRVLSDLYLSTLAETSARKSEMHRKNIAGADRDMLRAFATQGHADAAFISALENNAEVTKALVDMRRETGRAPDRMKASKIFNELMARHAMSMEYKPSPVVDKLMFLPTAWMLITSPAYYVQNLLQTAMVTVPVLNGKFGAQETWREMKKSYGQVAKTLSRTGEADLSKLPVEMRSVVDRLAERGRIDITRAEEMGRISEFGSADRLAWVDKLRILPQRVEVINRVTTGIAAYRLARKQDMDDAAALEYADEIIRQTHGDYTGFNAPRFMRSAGGKLVFQFRKYQLIQLSLLGRLAHDAFAGSSDAEKAAARAALKWTVTHTAVMGGALGIPAANLAGYVLALAFGDDEEPTDFEAMARDYIDNKELADLVLGGVPKYLGVDDMKVSLGNILDPLPYADKSLTRDGGESMLLGALGPLAGLGLRAYEGIGEMTKGNYYRGLEKLMPKGLADVAKGIKIANDGITNKRGDILVPAEDVSITDAFMQGIGYRTNTVADPQEKASTKYEFERFYKDRETELKDRYTRAKRDGDTATMGEIRQTWRNVQRAKRENGFDRTPMSVLLKAPMKQRERERNTVGGVQYMDRNRRFVKEEVEQ